MVNMPQREGLFPSEPDQRHALTLPGEPESAGVARQFAREHITSSEPNADAEYVEVVVLVTSELVTNSIRYGTEPGDQFEVALLTQDRRTRIEVRDPVRRHPQPRPVSQRRGRGRGLLILDGLCPAWGVTDAVFGKTVWAEVSSL
jgi:anti-sigma regulatory factor (Ser/Thr protein kinase)